MVTVSVSVNETDQDAFSSSHRHSLVASSAILGVDDVDDVDESVRDFDVQDGHRRARKLDGAVDVPKVSKSRALYGTNLPEPIKCKFIAAVPESAWSATATDPAYCRALFSVGACWV